MSSFPTPPGWYHDADGQQRYWDGVQWTSYVAPAAAPPGYGYPQQYGYSQTLQVAPKAGFSPFGVVAIIAAIGGTIGSFLPWLSAQSFLYKVELTGFNAGDGKLTAIAGGIAAVLGFLGFAYRSKAGVVLAAIVALGGLSVAFYDLSNANDVLSATRSATLTANLGIGLYVCIGGFAVSVVCMLIGLKDV